MVASGRKLGIVALSLAVLSCGIALPFQAGAGEASVSAAQMQLFEAAKAGRLAEIAVLRGDSRMAADNARAARAALAQVEEIQSTLEARRDTSRVAALEAESRLAAASEARQALYVAWADEVRRERRLLARGCDEASDTMASAETGLIRITASGDVERCAGAERAAIGSERRLQEPPALARARAEERAAQDRALTDRAALISAQTKLRHLERIVAEVRATVDRPAPSAVRATPARVGVWRDRDVFEMLQDTGFDQDALGSQN